MHLRVARRRPDQLTPRQREVMDLMAQGRTNPEIATELGMTIDGAKWHVREILSKFGVDSREAAVAEWHRRQRASLRLLLVAGGTLAAGVMAVAAGVGLWMALRETPSTSAGTTASATLAATVTTSPEATSSATSPATTLAESSVPPFAGAAVRDAGVAAAKAASPPATESIGGANSLVATGDMVLAANRIGISRSTDGGKDWTRVFSGAPMESLTTATDGSGYVALGHTPYIDDSDRGHAVLATSADGMHWQSFVPQVPVQTGQAAFGTAERIAFNGIGPHAVGIAVPDIVGTAAPGGAWRTTDGGRTWTALSHSADTGLQVMPDGQTVYATAGGPDPKTCSGEVYRSTDAGATWSGLPGSCEAFGLYAVQFLNPNIGFAAGGSPAKFGGDQVVEKTTDGGATWQTVWRTSPGPDPAKPASYDSEVVRLDMIDASHGWALTGGCTGGANGACGGAVYITDDGGMRWTRTGQVATAVAALSGQRALVSSGLSGPLATTTDGGEHWAVQAPAGSVTTGAFSGSGGWIAWTTSLGVFESKDGGRTWSAFDAPVVAAISDWPWSVASPGNVLGTSNAGGAKTAISTDNGQTFTESPVGTGTAAPGVQVLATAIGPGGEAAAITGPMRGCLDAATIAKTEKVKPGWKPPAGAVELFLSDDAGATWTASLELPFDVSVGNTLAIAGKTIAIVDACGGIHVSDDTGNTWQQLENGGKPPPLCSVAATGSEAWLACGTITSDSRWEGWVLTSENGGKSWTMLQLPSSMTTTEPLTSAGIVATDPHAAVMSAGAALWSTADDGKTWTESWPALPGEH